jgi:hypothetical protein
VVELATNQGILGAFNLTSTHLYWRGGDNVMRIAVAGGAPEVLYEGLVGLTGVAVDESRIYVTVGSDVGAPMVASLPLGGGALTPLSTDFTEPWDIEVDQGTLYFGVASQAADGGLYALPVDGGTPQQLVPGMVTMLEIWRDHVYFIANAPVPSLGRVPRAGGTAEQLIPQTVASHLAVDDTGVYLADGAGLVRVPLEGGALEVLSPFARLPSEASGPALDTRHAYFLDNDYYQGDLLRVGLDGSERTVLLAGGYAMRSIAVNDTTLFFAEYPLGERVLSMDKCGCP